MTEAEWLACADPERMIQHIDLKRAATIRKLRLFGVACCRRVWPLLTDKRARNSVEGAELYADGRASPAQRNGVHRNSSRLLESLRTTSDSPATTQVAFNAANAANWVSVADADFLTDESVNQVAPGGYLPAAATFIAGSAANAVFFLRYQGADADALLTRRRVDGLPTPADPIWEAEEAAQVALLRCIMGNPFRPVPIQTLTSATALSLAQATYKERDLPSGHLDNARLAVLSDALEEAGCTDEAILSHLRSPGPHVRGCWALDLVLGRG